jgi:hypothetical protein
MVLGSTQPLAEMSSRNLRGVKGRPARRADNLTTICEQLSRQNVGASTSHKPMDLHGQLQGSFQLLFLVLLAESVIPATSACPVVISLSTIVILLYRQTLALVWQCNHHRAKFNLIADIVIYLYTEVNFVCAESAG